MNTRTIPQLVEQAQNGDADAYGQLYIRFKHRIVTHLSDPHAEDMAQSTFLSAWSAIKTYDAAKAKFITWLFKIADREKAKYYRSLNTNARKKRGQPRQHYTEVSYEKLVGERTGPDRDDSDGPAYSDCQDDFGRIYDRSPIEYHYDAERDPNCEDWSLWPGDFAEGDTSPDYQGADLVDGPEEEVVRRVWMSEIVPELMADIYHDEEASEALYRKIVERKQLKDSAQESKVKPVTLRSKVHRAKKRLRQKFEAA